MTTLEIHKSVKCNEWILVNLENPFIDLDRFTKLDIQGKGAKNLVTQYRYSFDGTNYSEWVNWPIWKINNEFNNIWFEFRIKSESDWYFDKFILSYNEGYEFTGECIFNCRVYNENSFIVNCDSSQSEYNAAFGAVKIWEDLSMASFKRFGWPVIYFKVNGIKQSKDYIFNEYSLKEVSECKKLPIVIPNNDFGSGEFTFTDFDIDFTDDLSFQISKEMFWAAFGHLETPAEKDFIYFPLEGRMFRINSVQEEKGFMRKSFWWKGTLIKWNDSDNIQKSEDIQNMLDEITLNYSNTEFEQEMEDEAIDLRVQQQYTSRIISQNDNVRESVDIMWEQKGIVSENLTNYYTVFSKYQYDLNFTENKEILKYQSTIDSTDSFSIMFWYKGTNRKTDFNNVYLKVFSGNNDIEFNINNNNIIGIKVFDKEFNVNIPVDNWYAYYIAFNKVDNNVVLRVFERQDLNKKTTKMSILVEKTCPVGTIQSNWKPTLWSSSGFITNIRFLKGLVKLEDQSTLFTQLIFKDSSKSYIIDDCWKILYLEKLSGR